MTLKSGNRLRKVMNGAEVKSTILGVFVLYQCFSEGV